MIESVLEAIQQDIADRLLADPYFSDIPVIPEILKDVENEVERAVKQIGAMVLIVTPVASITLSKDAPPYFDEIDIVCRCSEHVILNRSPDGTGKHVLSIAEHVLVVLHHYAPSNIIEMVYSNAPSIRLVADPTGLLSYDCRFRTQGGLLYDIPVVADPVISRSGGNIVITCATSYANVFYALPGERYPNPRTGHFYAGPFAAANGTVIRAKGWLAGYMNSKQVTATP